MSDFSELNGYTVKDALSREQIGIVGRFNGKKILLVGDSLSDENRAESSPCWVTFFKEMMNTLGCQVDNVSKSGMTFSNVKTDNNMESVLSPINTKYDYIILNLGTNDWANNATRQQMVDAVGYFFSWLRNRNPNAFVYVVTPTKAIYTTNAAVPLDYYRLILTTYAVNYGWAIIDAFAEAPNFNGNISALKSLFTTDGLHYNPAYAPIYAEYIFRRILSGTSSHIAKFTTRITTENFFGTNSLFTIYKSDGSVELVMYLGTNPTEKTVSLTLPEFCRPYKTKDFRVFANKSGGIIEYVNIRILEDGTMQIIFPETGVTYANILMNIEYKTYIAGVQMVG